MPNRDATGPMGMGALTGRGMGPCNEGTGRRYFGFQRRGFTGRRGRRMGMGQGAYFVDDSLDEIETLKNRIAELEEKIDSK